MHIDRIDITEQQLENGATVFVAHEAGSDVPDGVGATPEEALEVLDTRIRETGRNPRQNFRVLIQNNVTPAAAPAA